METTVRRGKLLVWKDEKGLGFIESDKGGESILLPLSALKKGYRRPQVGDTILYSLRLEVDGKLSACDASIEGIAPQSTPDGDGAPSPGLIKLAIGCGLVIVLGIVLGSFFLNQSEDTENRDAAAAALIT